MNGRTNTTSVTEVIEGVQVPLEAPTNLVLTPLNARVDITWTDPVDKFAAPDGQTATNPWDNVATWDHTIIVRKANSAPTSPSDGELIYTETTRNQHQYTAYSDTNNVINNTVYYYAVYAITTMDAVSESIVDSCKPIEGIPTFIQRLDPFTYPDDPTTSSGTSISNYALFSFGSDEQTHDGIIASINTQYTKQQLDSLSLKRHPYANIKNSLYGIFGPSTYDYGSNEPGQIDIYDTNLTHVTIEFDDFEFWREYGGSATLNEYTVFAGGSTYVNYVRSYRKAIACNGTFTEINLTDLPDDILYMRYPYICQPCGYNLANAIAVSKGYLVSCYNQSLTQSTLTSFTDFNQSNDDVSSFNNNIILFNDNIVNNSSGCFEFYNQSLTKSSSQINLVPSYPTPDRIDSYQFKQSIEFGNNIIIQLAAPTAGPDYFTYYILDSSLTLHGEMPIDAEYRLGGIAPVFATAGDNMMFAGFYDSNNDPTGASGGNDNILVFELK